MWCFVVVGWGFGVCGVFKHLRVWSELPHCRGKKKKQRLKGGPLTRQRETLEKILGLGGEKTPKKKGRKSQFQLTLGYGSREAAED